MENCIFNFISMSFEVFQITLGKKIQCLKNSRMNNSNYEMRLWGKSSVVEVLNSKYKTLFVLQCLKS